MRKVYSVTCIFLFSVILLVNQAQAIDVQKLVEPCAACHGANGNKTLMDSYPKLASQHRTYIAEQLDVFKKGTDKTNNPNYRASDQAAIMYAQVQNLSEEDIYAIGNYYSQQKITGREISQKVADKARNLYLGGNLEHKIPACAACHGPQGYGNEGAKFPRLAGQNADYIKQQLINYKNKTRGNDMMQDIAAKLSDNEIELVSQLIQALK